MSNPQWAVRLKPELYSQLDRLIKYEYQGDRQQFMREILALQSDEAKHQIRNKVIAVMAYNDEQSDISKKLFINFQLIYRLMGNRNQVAIRDYLKRREQAIQQHHENTGLADALRSHNSQNMMRIEKANTSELSEAAIGILEKSEEQILEDRVRYINTLLQSYGG